MIRRGDRNIHVQIFQQVSTASNVFNVPSIDLHMYEISERKDIFMKILERVIKKSAFDCALNIERNYIDGYDNQRECDYNKCHYTCDGQIMTPLDTTTYNLYYSMTNRVKEELASYFKYNSSIRVQQLFNRLSYLNEFEVISALRMFIDNNTQFRDRFNKPVYIRIATIVFEEIIYVTTDITVQNYDNLAPYYSLNLTVTSKEDFNNLLNRLYEDKLPDMIDSLFMYSEENTISVLNTLSSYLQRIVLEACLEAQLLQKDKNVTVRDIILSYFKGNYDEIHVDNNSYTIIWLHKNDFGVVYAQYVKGVSQHDTSTDWDTPAYSINWIDCVNKEQTFINKVNEHINRFKEHLLLSPIGYYGMYNRLLDDFCLRDVSTAKTDNTRKTTNLADLRKLSAGRRCIDFDLPTLVDIIARRIKMPPPDNYLNNYTLDRLINTVKNKKKLFKEQDLENVDSMKIFIYWSEQKRNAICSSIRSWLDKQGLVEMNTDCGTQRKQRARMIR
jgi:hypothetical protein